jgi:1-deoxy-D-xylulose-5-phosphate reductoisomerase
MTKSIALLGATGSIGRSALDVVRRHPGRFRVVSMSAHANDAALLASAREFGVTRVALTDAEAAARARGAAWNGLTVIDGARAAEELACDPQADIVLNAIVGAAGLRATIRALETGRPVALANKESMVVGGELVTAAARSSGAPVIPIDSEHSGLFQCLDGRDGAEVARLWLTASGGALRDESLESVATAPPARVLQHPTWAMGPRITVDSATLLNKGFEIIEARWLFDVPTDSIDVVLHAQSIVHAFVEFADGSFLAQCGPADMRTPIQYALSYPERLPSPAPPLSPARFATLTFAEPDPRRYPCLALARVAARAGGTAPAALNAADETAIEAFLSGRIPFGAIPRVLESVLYEHAPVSHPSVEDIEAADAWARESARRYFPV